MILSMTGFGKAASMFNDKKIRVEIKSLNSKNLDLQVKMSSQYREKEVELRNKLLRQLHRGKVELSIYVEEGAAAETKLSLNQPALKAYFEDLKKLSLELNDVPAAILPNLLHLPDAFKSKVSELDESEWGQVTSTIEEAVEKLLSFRKSEGEALTKDLMQRIADIRRRAEDVKKLLPARKERVRTKLVEAIAALGVENHDENRFEQELIYYLEKLDISEEEVRLAQHLTYFEETMNSGSQNGRKLGFIAQEIGREINTMGSKANDADIQRLVVKMKDDLEKIKEQVLNVL